MRDAGDDEEAPGTASGSGSGGGSGGVNDEVFMQNLLIAFNKQYTQIQCRIQIIFTILKIMFLIMLAFQLDAMYSNSSCFTTCTTCFC